MAEAGVQGVLALAGRVRLLSRSLHMFDLLDGLVEKGIHVTLLCDSLPSQLTTLNLKYPVLNWSALGARWPSFAGQAVFDKFLKRQKAQLIHVHGVDLRLPARRLVSMGLAPVVFTPYQTDAGRQVHRLNRQAHRIIALSEFMRQRLATAGKAPREKLRIVPPGLNLSQYEQLLPDMERRTAVVGVVAPFEPQRGQMTFLQAAQRLLESGRNAQFILAGDGPMERELRQEAARLGILEKVTFVTRLPNYRMVIAGLDILARPAVRGGLSYTVLEAMAMGKAIVATSTGETPELLVGDESGRLIEHSNAAELAGAVSRLLDHPEEAREMGRRARLRVAERFNMESLVERTRMVYKEAMDQYHLENPR